MRYLSQSKETLLMTPMKEGKDGKQKKYKIDRKENYARSDYTNNSI